MKVVVDSNVFEAQFPVILLIGGILDLIWFSIPIWPNLIGFSPFGADLFCHIFLNCLR